MTDLPSDNQQPEDEVIDVTDTGQPDAPERRMSDRLLKQVALNIESLTLTAGELVTEVRRSNEQVESDRQLQIDIRSVMDDNRRLMKRTQTLLKAVWVKVILLLVIMVFVLAALNIARSNAQAARQATDSIKDCTTPQGLCFKYNNARSAGIVLDIEAKRNVTELGLAERRGDTLSIDYRRAVIGELNDDVATLNDYAEQLRTGKNPPPPVLKSQTSRDAVAAASEVPSSTTTTAP